MLQIISALFGATLIYTGVLVFSINPGAAMAVILGGIVFVGKPTAIVYRYVQNLYGFELRSGAAAVPRKPATRGKGHLTLVKPKEEERPTIH